MSREILQLIVCKENFIHKLLCLKAAFINYLFLDFSRVLHRFFERFFHVGKGCAFLIRFGIMKWNHAKKYTKIHTLWGNCKKRRGNFRNAMLHVLPLVEARRLLAKLMKKNAVLSERVHLSDGFGRVLAWDVVANEDIPPFDRSAVDGFAVVSRDTFGASPALPALLRVAGEVKMGESARFSLEGGDCATVLTGGELPRGADAVAMLEEAR